MRRLCVFVTYDCENTVDKYIGYLLREFRKAVDALVVVCNYEYIIKGVEYIQPYADQVYYRSNKGFDAGAYKDAICQYLGFNEINKYDELLLMNDSFYGPLYPISQVFQRMDNTDADYWGLVRAPVGNLYESYSYDSHIQSYFLVFRKKILLSSAFRVFWETMDYPATFTQAIISFELNGNDFFSKAGFKGVALTDFLLNYDFEKNENPYLLYSLELIRDARIPILKRKCLDFSNRGFSNALEAFKYIERKECYDVGLIKEHMFRLGRSKSGGSRIDFQSLDKFYQAHSRIYFYGAGICAKNLAIYFEYRGWLFQGYLVTDINGQKSKSCFLFQEAEIKEDDGIIVTVMDYDIYLEILRTVQTRCSRKQIFSLYHKTDDKIGIE